MPFISLNLNTDIDEVRKFGLIVGAILIACFGLLFPLLGNRPFPSWPWLPAIPLLILAWVAPITLKVPYVLWMKVGHVLGAINSCILLAVVYFVMITPIAIILRLRGRSPLNIRQDANTDSYRVPNSTRHNASQMESPF